jgi:hypothetical protein
VLEKDLKEAKVGTETVCGLLVCTESTSKLNSMKKSDSRVIELKKA